MATTKKAPAVRQASKPAAKKDVAAKPVATKARPAAKPVKAVKPAPAATKPAPSKPAAKTPKSDGKAPKADKAPKAKKPKLVRDSFTMPEAEYAVIAQVKKACLASGFEVKKSELLRVGMELISKLEPAKIKAVLSALPPLKAGRPKK